jgi:hypothetical protein
MVTHVVGWAGGGRKDPIPRVCKRPYLIQVHGTPSVRKGTVITCQKKAWMDSPGVAMWEDVSLAELGRKLVIWDNCGPHKVEAVQKVFHEAETATAELPPNMTDCLQVSDLVTNGPLKAGCRRKRAEDLYEYMQTWRHKRLKARADGAALPPFDPPKPTVDMALRNLFAVEMNELEKASYKQSLRNCFVRAFQQPDPKLEDFRRYTDPKAGLLGVKLDGVASVDGDGRLLQNPRASLTDTLSAVEFVPNPEQREPEDWSSDSGGSDNDDSDDG